MKTVKAPDGQVTRYFYNAVGNRDSVSNANGTSTGYRYDNLNRLTKVTNYGPGNSMISSYTYMLNNAGIRTAVTELDGSRVDFGYDPSYKLTSEERTGINPYSIDYMYDNVGNRLTKIENGSTTTYSYNTRDQLTTESSSAGTITYNYDAAGRQIRKNENSGVTSYSWVDNDRMESVNGPSVSVSYEYDNAGQRVSENSASGEKNYLIDYQLPYGQVIAESDAAGNVVVGYVYGMERISQNRNSNVHYYVADGQGSIRQMTDNTGNVTDSWTYDAFGNIINRTGTTENSFTYTGESFDPNAGFYYLRARWYKPENGRFTSVDPYEGENETPLTQHRYIYAGADPINLNDPTGEFFGISEMTAMIAMLSTVSISATMSFAGQGGADHAPTRKGFDDMWRNYPIGLSAESVYILIGGKVEWNYWNNPNFRNSCALRMSRALNYGGYPITKQAGTGSGADNKWYFYIVDALEKHIRKVFGPPDMTNVSAGSVQMKKGIVLFRNCGWDDATGHFDLWNRVMFGGGGYWGECGNNYFWGFK
jgi:RHS repeat-associated protein